MDTTAIKERFVRLEPFLNERQRRLAAAAEAQSLGRGGILAVAGATGVARKSIARGLQELAQVTLQRADFHGEWNDTTLPRPKPTDTLIL
ncbi:MAG: hypothetical protein ACOYL7_13855 [Caldilinea sp.]